MTRSNNNCYPRKFLATWENAKRKNGAPQLTCNNNFASKIELMLKKSNSLSSKQAPLKEWIPLAKDETKWKMYIDAYFESCCTVKSEDEDNSDCESNIEEVLVTGDLHYMNEEAEE